MATRTPSSKSIQYRRDRFRSAAYVPRRPSWRRPSLHLTRHFASAGNRSTWSRQTGVNLELPVHSCIKLGETMQITDNENAEYQRFAYAIHVVARTFDFIVIDTPGPTAI